MKLLQWIKEHRVFFDGGLGSLLQERGLKPGELPETWNLLHPEVLVEIHKNYLQAGANILTTNTFGLNGLKFPAGGEWDLAALVTAAVENAAKARKEYEKQSQEYQRSYYDNFYSNYSNNKNSSYAGIFSSNYTEEEKKIFKEFYRTLSKKFHPDANPDMDTSRQMKLLNRLKSDWGV